MEISKNNSIQTFIVYAHQSEHHSKRVLAFADRLCKDGIDCRLDQYVQNPAEGWTRWMENQINSSDYILVICTESYNNRTRFEASKGKGVKFESLLTYQDIVDNRSKNEKFIPVLFDKADEQYIPKPLRPFQFYVLYTNDGYEELYRRLTKQPRIIKPPRGKIRSLPTGTNLTDNENINNNFDKVGQPSENDITIEESHGDVAVKLDKMNIELRIDRDFEKFTKNEQEKLLSAVGKLLEIPISELKIIKKRKGSVYLTFELASDKAEKLLWAVKAGHLSGYGVMDAEVYGADMLASKAKAKAKAKAISGKIDFVIETIKKMTTSELGDLTKAMEDEYGISIQESVVTAEVDPDSVGAPKADKEKKEEFDVVITAVGNNKILVIKEVRSITDSGLKEAKNLVDSALKVVKASVSRDQAEEIKRKLEEVGAKVEIR